MYRAKVCKLEDDVRRMWVSEQEEVFGFDLEVGRCTGTCSRLT